MVEGIIELLVGLAVFMTGMEMMSGGLKKAAGRGLKNLFRKIQNNKIAGLGIGAAVTSIIQSSSATSVIVVGFVNAGVMTLLQAVCIIMGAYIGTTVTGLIVSLSSFSISIYLMSFAFIGLVMMFFHNVKIKNIGTMLCGFGILFFGLETMSGAMKNQAELTQIFTNLFQTVKLPVLLVLIGLAFTAIIQSSSATSGIVIVMATSGIIPPLSGMYIMLGASVGTVVTTLLASIGSNVNSKRAAWICLFMRLATAIVGTAIMWTVDACIPGQIEAWLSSIFGDHLGMSIAIFYLLYNIVFNLLLLPFAGKFCEWGEKIIKEKKDKKLISCVKYIDDKMVNTPTIATMMAKKEILRMMELSFENLKRGYKRIITQDESEDEELIDTEDTIDKINERLTSFLIEISPKAEENDAKKIGAYFHVINDIERIGDHANNFYKESCKMVDDEVKFSDEAKEEFSEMFTVVEKMCDLVMVIFRDKDKSKLPELHDLETKTDDMKRNFSDAHYLRLKDQKCSVEVSPFYTTFISNLERVADHLTNVGYSIVDPTGADIDETN